MKRISVLVPLLLSGCVRVPQGVTAIQGFEPERYLGTWYEIARFDHSFERGLTHVSAEYSARPDGGIDVVNRGYDPVRGQWKQARAKAYFVEGRSVGRLRVTFFWPFYGAYNIIALDQDNYSYAVVCGPNRSYLWILARQTALDAAVLDRLIAVAKDAGFDTRKLLRVDHTNRPPSS